MSSEQKSILGILSKRQVLYLIVGVIILYSYIPWIFNVFSHFNIAVAFIACIIASLPIVVTIYFLGFHKVAKKGLNFDHYLLIKMGYKNQIGVWRKGGR